MLRKPLALIILAFVPLLATAEEHIYRWVDDQGLVHYGDTVPDKYKDKATRKPELKDPQIIDANGTAKEQRARAQARKIIEGAPEEAANTGSPPVKNATTPANPSGNGNLTCEQKWQRYNASQACFAPYRLANGGLRPGAYEHCEAVPEPPRCE